MDYHKLIRKVYDLAYNKNWEELKKLYESFNLPSYTILDYDEEYYDLLKDNHMLHGILDYEENNSLMELFWKFYPNFMGWYDRLK